MTIRSEINRKKRRVMGSMLGGLVVFAAAMSQEAFALGIAAFAFALGSMLYAYFGIACPNCKERWGQLALNSGPPLSVSKRLRYCPFCGKGLDEDLRMDRGQPPQHIRRG